jgi:hypothetical protein
MKLVKVEYFNVSVSGMNKSEKWGRRMETLTKIEIQKNITLSCIILY